MENTLGTDETSQYKLYTLGQIGVATYLGGPIAGCYLVSENFKHFDNTRLANKIQIIGIVSTFLLFAGILLVPERIMDSIPNMVIPLIYTALIAGYAQKSQGETIKESLAIGYQKYSGWRVAGVSLGFLFLELLYIIALVIVIPEEFLA